MSSSISILLPDLRGGGAERVRIVLAHEFTRAGHDVEFVVMRARGELLEEVRSSFPVIDLAVPRAGSLPFPLARYLRRRRPDALLVAMWPLTGIAGLAARLARYSGRVVASEHIDFRETPSRKGFERWALRYVGNRFYGRCDGIVAVSAGVADSLSEAAALPREGISVIHNPVRRFPPGSLDAKEQHELMGWLNSDARLIAIGTLKRMKRFDVLLNALAELRCRVDARLLILGEGTLRGELQELAAELGVADSVWLPGYKSNPQTFLQHANAFVLSSDYEGFGNVVVEALSRGVSVVSTDCRSGPAEILQNGRYGRLVPSGDSSAMARAIEAILHEPINSVDLEARAADFAPDQAAARYLELLTGAAK